MAAETLRQRNIYADRLTDLITQRNTAIEQEMANYRVQLEKAYPTDEIEKVKRVVDAFDEVIALEHSLECPAEPVVEDRPVEVVAFEEVPTEPTVDTVPSTAFEYRTGRAGMTSVTFPTRK